MGSFDRTLLTGQNLSSLNDLLETWDFSETNIAPENGWLEDEMSFWDVDDSEIRRENQLRLVVYPTINKVYIPGG